MRGGSTGDDDAEAGRCWIREATCIAVISASLKYVPLHRQIEQPAKRPAADPHWLRGVEPQSPEPRKNAGQRHVGDHRARGKSAGAIMRAGAEGDAFGGIARDVEM